MIPEHVILTQSLAPETANVAKAGRYHSFTIILKYMRFVRTIIGPQRRIKNNNV
jgi:hypothetical protein